jgi:hypothetical protein
MINLLSCAGNESAFSGIWIEAIFGRTRLRKREIQLDWPGSTQPRFPMPLQLRQKYVILCMSLLLIAWVLFGLPEAMRSQRPGRFNLLFILSAVLFNHIALFWIQRPIVRRIASAVSIAWSVFVCAYLFTQYFTGRH